MAATHSLSIDFGAKYIGVALIRHSPKVANRVLYAAVIVVEPKPLKAAIDPRAGVRRIRRTRKTHRRRLRQLAQALDAIPGSPEVLRFGRRRGYSYDRKDDAEELAQAVSREEFFAALVAEIERVVPKDRQEYVLERCRKHLNAECRLTAELRPARFENRHPTKCQWEGCTKNVPRKANAPGEQLSQTLYVWLKPIFDDTRRKEPLGREIDCLIERMVGLARAYGKEPDAAAKTALSKQKRRVFAEILDRVRRSGEEETVQKFTKNWKTTYSRQLTDILTKHQGGRLRYCRDHSREFVDAFLAGRQPPHRTDVLVSDLFGRSQQILFERLWRLVAARILPLAGGRIDRVVVERVAFDVLAGPFKQRNKVSEDRAAQMYWHGPMFGFESRLAMLKEEFDGRCAYCGRKRSVSEIEHILPRSEFPFDSYFNVLPTCRECNRRKGARTPSEAGMRVDEKAYTAYSEYVSKKKPTPHLFHTIKKGMLKLMAGGGSMASAERQLALLANNLVSISNTQKAPRPLARFLASQISKASGGECKAEWLSGRHTALYRGIVLPDYDKKADKEQDGLVNHAVDAIVAGCDLPSAAALENPRWFLKKEAMLAWREKVQAAGPELCGKVPKVEPIERLEFFENDLGAGYLRIDLSAFNWNRQRQSGFAQDPFGATGEGQPLKRKPADDVLVTLLDAKTRDRQIAAIAHVGLRSLLESRPEEAGRLFVGWLQKTTSKGLAEGQRGTHPSDLARYEALETFVNTPVEEFLRPKLSTEDKRKDEPPPERPTIPPTIGIRCINKGVPNKLDVARLNGTHQKAQLFAAQKSKYQVVFVGYRAEEDGTPDRTMPLIFGVNQGYAVTFTKSPSAKWTPVTEDVTSLLRGIPLGTANRKKVLSRWWAELESVFEDHGIVQRFRITQGCYIEKMDGTGFQLRNFDKKQDWMKSVRFKNIRRVYRSPLRALVGS